MQITCPILQYRIYTWWCNLPRRS